MQGFETSLGVSLGLSELGILIRSVSLEHKRKRVAQVVERRDVIRVRLDRLVRGLDGFRALIELLVSDHLDLVGLIFKVGGRPEFLEESFGHANPFLRIRLLQHGLEGVIFIVAFPIRLFRCASLLASGRLLCAIGRGPGRFCR